MKQILLAAALIAASPIPALADETFLCMKVTADHRVAISLTISLNGNDDGAFIVYRQPEFFGLDTTYHRGVVGGALKATIITANDHPEFRWELDDAVGSDPSSHLMIDPNNKPIICRPFP